MGLPTMVPRPIEAQVSSHTPLVVEKHTLVPSDCLQATNLQPAPSWLLKPKSQHLALAHPDRGASQAAGSGSNDNRLCGSLSNWPSRNQRLCSPPRLQGSKAPALSCHCPGDDGTSQCGNLSSFTASSRGHMFHPHYFLSLFLFCFVLPRCIEIFLSFSNSGLPPEISRFSARMVPHEFVGKGKNLS